MECICALVENFSKETGNESGDALFYSSVNFEIKFKASTTLY